MGRVHSHYGESYEHNFLTSANLLYRLAYLCFDWLNVLVTSVIIIIILAASTPNNWWHVGYLFVVLFLYGLTSLLWAYTISLLAKSQLAAFAISAGSQA